MPGHSSVTRTPSATTRISRSPSPRPPSRTQAAPPANQPQSRTTSTRASTPTPPAPTSPVPTRATPTSTPKPALASRVLRACQFLSRSASRIDGVAPANTAPPSTRFSADEGSPQMTYTAMFAGTELLHRPCRHHRRWRKMQSDEVSQPVLVQYVTIAVTGTETASSL